MRIDLNRLFFIPVIVLLTVSRLSAAPVVLYDSGHTQPVPSPGQPVRITLPSSPGPQDAPAVFPVKTPEMKPGRVIPRKINRPALTHPVFIIGADPLSLKWLKYHAEQLKKLQASGVIVNITSAEQLQRIRRMAPGLTITPMPGRAIARQLRLSHYPALISRTRIEQ